jgi:hypothetical protein
MLIYHARGSGNNKQPKADKMELLTIHDIFVYLQIYVRGFIQFLKDSLEQQAKVLYSKLPPLDRRALRSNCKALFSCPSFIANLTTWVSISSILSLSNLDILRGSIYFPVGARKREKNRIKSSVIDYSVHTLRIFWGGEVFWATRDSRSGLFDLSF